MSNPATWADAKRVFEAALDLPEGDRAAFVDKACSGNAALLEEVRSLITWHKGSTGFLERPAGRTGDMPAEAESAVRLIGKSIGAWRILDVVGSGGMGVVYRAERADAAFRRHAALKVVRPGPDSPQIMERFRLERETLAALDHPNIARLMDGGTTGDGQPFFVMDLVDGDPIDRYCDDHRLSIDERLDLFRKVCAGVQYAHENLVVHRDIKPDNILVTKDGVPKLLDFGVAKLLSRDGGQSEDPAATAATWAMTPDYASPEQVSGRPSTTATDVYSLGVLLHVLLTGARPYTLTGTTPAAIEKQLLEFTLIPPSERALSSPESDQRAILRGTNALKLAKRLTGDLDAIVLRALGRLPSSRYSSVEQLAEDVARHRAHRPVHARGRATGYTTRLFVRRHRGAIAVAALLVAVVVGGIGAVLWQASQTAEARRRAERRFNDVRALAGSFIFDVYDAIDDVPGTTPARELIVQKAVQYLDSLAREASGDAGLQRELANAFIRVGDVQGNPTRANAGGPTRAIGSYQRAIALAEAVRADAPGDVEALRTLALAYRQRGDVLALTGDKDKALADVEESEQLYSQIAARDGATPDDRLNVGLASIKLGDLLGNPNFQNLGRTGSANLAYAKALDTFRQLDQAAPTNLRVRRLLGLTLERIGTMHEDAKQWTDAGTAYQESFEIRRGLAEREPTHRDIQRDLGIAHEKVANVLLAQGNTAGAVGEQRQALAVFERLAGADPTDVNAARTVAISRENLGDALRKSGGVTETLDLYRKALDAHRAFRTQDVHNVRATCDVARIAEALGDVLSSAEAPGACAAWRESQSARQSLSPGTSGCTPDEMTRVTLKLGGC
ncbi:MAG TPA: serine/threonine-protein kinase [Vicinamibacterales bacterium]|jgi:non-specific serine/threonine protein kinase/serine/threonine-protein kinase|nr:serine/threonine-protein kinase [Vicinamibacterales bacterium]